MRLITAPTVEVVGITRFVGSMHRQIPTDGDDSVKLCSFAAKGCYDSFGAEGRSNKHNQNTILQSGHGSVLEHFSVSLWVEGISRGLSLELNRHRHFAISQRSTRYTDEDDAAIVLDPYYAAIHYKLGHERSPLENRILNDHIRSAAASVMAYRVQVKDLMEHNPLELKGTELRKWARGKARNLLPHGLETRGTWTTNIRSIRHIIEMRSQRYAEEEIRRFINIVAIKLQQWIPFYLQDYEKVMHNGIPEYQTEYRKV